jgi:hypothetical protein
MKVSDITDDYIKENFNIDKNRKIKTVQKDVCEIDFESLVFSNPDIVKKMNANNLDFDVFWEMVREQYKARTEMALKEYKKLKGFMDAHFYVKVETVYSDSGHPFDTGDEGFQIIIKAKIEQLETDKSVIGRLKAREKQKIKKKEEKDKNKESKRKQLEKLAKELNFEVKEK